MAGRTRTRALLLQVVATDATFHRATWRGDEVWEGKCIHCGRRHHLTLTGDPISRATLEHILPRTHGGTDDVENLAIACARCNHGKGIRHDRSPRGDPKLEAMIERLRRRRAERWRAPEP